MHADRHTFHSDQPLGAALAQMTRVFADAGIESAPRDARALLQGLLGIDGAALLTQSERSLGSLADRIGDAVRRRIAHEPVSRILGVRAFYGRDFIVTPNVLDPRPDTETIVEHALEIVARAGLTNAPLRIADIGTGSGILLVTLLAELPRASGVATDISEAALAVAKNNAERLGVAKRATFIATSGLDGCSEAFDLVVSNPPYIETREIAGLDPEVRNFDPHLALDGGSDGLSVYRKIANDIRKADRQVHLVVEVGAGQAPDVEGIFRSAKWQALGRKQDLGGHDRSVAFEVHP